MPDFIPVIENRAFPRIFLSLMLLAGAYGCAFHVATPPTNFVKVVTAESVPPGKSKFTAEISGISEVFESDFSLANLTYTLGLPGNMDITLAGSEGFIDVIEPETNPEPYYHALDLSWKKSAFESHAAIFGGWGMGWSNYANVQSWHVGVMVYNRFESYAVGVGPVIHYSTPSKTRMMVLDQRIKRMTKTVSSLMNVSFGYETPLFNAYFTGTVGRSESETDILQPLIGFSLGVGIPLYKKK